MLTTMHLDFKIICAGFTEQLEGMHEFSHDTRFHTYLVDLEALNSEILKTQMQLFFCLVCLFSLTLFLNVNVSGRGPEVT